MSDGKAAQVPFTPPRSTTASTGGCVPPQPTDSRVTRSLFSLDHLKFGDAAVLFTNYPEFLRRVARVAERIGHRVSHGLVEYVDDGGDGVAIYPSRLPDFRQFRLGRRPQESPCVEVDRSLHPLM